MTFDEALENLTLAHVMGADSVTLTACMTDLNTIFPAHRDQLWKEEQ